jgi:outer membrane protein assembly factor BamB
MKTRLVAFCVALWLSVLSGLAFADNWPRFRGPNGQGISAEKGLPTKWSATENVAWKVDVAAEGWSSPVVWGDRLFVTGTTDKGVACHVLCFNKADGNLIWDKKVFDQATTRKEGKNSYATPTPTTDGQAVYALFGGGGVAALDFDGKILWTNQDNRYYSRHGLGASPIVYKDLVIFSFDPSIVPGPGIDELIGWQIAWDKSFVLALDKATGKEKWRGKRGLSRLSHITPIIATVGGKEQLISPAGDVIQGFEPDTGELLWTVRSGGEGVVPSPILAGDNLLVAQSGFPTKVPTGAAVRAVKLDPAARGDVTATHIAWEQKKNVPNLPSMVFLDGRLYGAQEGGFALCLDAKSGDVLWRERLGGNSGALCASPVLAGGVIYLLAESGETTLLQPGPEFKEIARNSLGDGVGPTQASMAVSDGKLFIRTAKHLWCIGKEH